jgi:hypothetical protein
VCRGIPFSPHALTMSQWPGGGNVGVGVVPSLRACRARPSAGWAIRARMALRGKPWDNREGGLFGGARSPRPRIRAGRKPERVMLPDELERGRWPNGGTFRLALCLPRGRAEPAPPRNRDPDKGNQRLQRRDASVRRDADIAGVRSPPLRETGTPQGGPAASKARCIGKARCRYFGRAEPAPPGG